MKRILESVVLLACGLICILLNYYLNLTPIMSAIVSLGLATVIGACLFEIINKYLIKSDCLRKSVDKEAAYEGYWFHGLEIDSKCDGRAFGLFRFYYDKGDKEFQKYRYVGKDYALNGTIVCTCDFDDIRVGSKSGFLYTGTVCRGNKTYKNIGEFIYVDSNCGMGYFENVGSEYVISGNYNGCKITSNEIMELLGKPVVQGLDFDTLAIEYFNKKYLKRKN